jgi:hypothetical protein
MDIDQETWRRQTKENAKRAQIHCQQLQYVAIIYHRFLQEFLWENSIDPIQRGRSTFGRQKHKRRRIERGHNRIMDVYFDLIDPLYDEEDFCQCF